MPSALHPVGVKLDTGENPFQTALRKINDEANISAKNIILEAVVQQIAKTEAEQLPPLIYLLINDMLDGGASSVFATVEYDEAEQNIVKSAHDICER